MLAGGCTVGNDMAQTRKATRGTSWFERSQTSSIRGRNSSSISTAPKLLRPFRDGLQTKATMWQTSTAGWQITVVKS
ncbi:hypothetical protein CDHC03_1647 [Corynebacterium diphtheriae HC03]|nr:hypothetical protein CDHC03_1647 [Corynebacterium diphtheriae HC03]AEX81636.1 hypothetical protein CDHC04_1645 [Corynebacterium diphtheriae HC04]